MAAVDFFVIIGLGAIITMLCVMDTNNVLMHLMKQIVVRIMYVCVHNSQ